LVYNTIWELYEYKNNNKAGEHSTTQRIEYLKAAKEIVKNNFLTGVGTGNVQIAFDNEYNKSNSQLESKWRLRAHNQFITFLITFGIFGFLWIVFAMFYPFIKLKGYKSFLFIVFFFIAVLSFFNEDTLETQAGITFFVFFYSILLFSKENPVVQKEQ
jgi:O-antigen ligase